MEDRRVNLLSLPLPRRRSLRALGALAATLVAGALSAATASAAPWIGSDGPWTGTGSANTTVLSDGMDGSAMLTYASRAPSGEWSFDNTATSARQQTIYWHYKGFHAWAGARVSIVRYQRRFGFTFTQTLASAGPAVGAQAPAGGFDYYGKTTFDLLPGDHYGFRMTGGNTDSDLRLQGLLMLTS
jgi:hypothetical protein